MKARAGIRLLGLVVLLFLLLVLRALAQYDTGWQDPSQDMGAFEAPFQAYHDGGGAAIAGRDESHQYWGYSFSLPAGMVVEGIEVRLDAWRESGVPLAALYVELSWDGGISWTSTGYNTGPLATTETTYILGGPNDTWGRTWTASELSDANFRVRITTSGLEPGKVIHLDWVPVKVYYAPALELTVIDHLTDSTIAQADLDSWFGDPEQVQQPLGSFDVTITARVNYQVEACYEVTPGPSPPFTDDPLKVENPRDSNNWVYLPQCPATIQLLGFSGTPGTETRTYPVEIDLSRLGDQKGGQPFQFTIRVRASQL